MGARHFCGSGTAEQREAELDLRAKELEYARDTSLAVNREPPEHRAADHDGACAERERLQRVGSASDAAVEQHLRTSVDGLDDLRQSVEGRSDTVQLAAAVVRDDDAGGTVLNALGSEPVPYLVALAMAAQRTRSK